MNQFLKYGVEFIEREIFYCIESGGIGGCCDVESVGDGGG